MTSTHDRFDIDLRTLIDVITLLNDLRNLIHGQDNIDAWDEIDIDYTDHCVFCALDTLNSKLREYVLSTIP